MTNDPFKEKISVGVYWYNNVESPTSTPPRIVIDYDEMVKEFENRLQELENTYGDGDEIRLNIEWRWNSFPSSLIVGIVERDTP